MKGFFFKKKGIIKKILSKLDYLIGFIGFINRAAFHLITNRVLLRVVQGFYRGSRVRHKRALSEKKRKDYFLAGTSCREEKGKGF